MSGNETIFFFSFFFFFFFFSPNRHSLGSCGWKIFVNLFLLQNLRRLKHVKHYFKYEWNFALSLFLTVEGRLIFYSAWKSSGAAY